METELDENFSNLKVTLSKCIYPAEFDRRPDSKQLIYKMDEWVIPINDVLNEENFSKTKELLNKFENKFFIKYLTCKLNI